MTLYASHFRDRSVLDGFRIEEIRRDIEVWLDIGYSEGEESTATDLTTNPLNVVVSLGLFLIPVTLLRCP